MNRAVDAVVSKALICFIEKQGGVPDSATNRWVTEATTVVVEALNQMQPEHYVDFDEEENWIMQHSMRCRIEGNLLECPIHKVLVKGGSGGRRGLYVAILDDSGERVGLLRA